MFFRFPAILLSCALMVSLSACEGVNSYGNASGTTETRNYVRLAPAPPPPSQPEDKPIIDMPQMAIWRPGHWVYDGANFNWVPGVIMNRPSPTAAWSPDRWVRHEFGWGFEPGHWQ
jgi:hypothetical protein